jgi:hypothetical protein
MLFSLIALIGGLAGEHVKATNGTHRMFSLDKTVSETYSGLKETKLDVHPINLSGERLC